MIRGSFIGGYRQSFGIGEDLGGAVKLLVGHHQSDWNCEEQSNRSVSMLIENTAPDFVVIQKRVIQGYLGEIEIAV